MKRRPALLLELLTAFILMGGVIALLMTGFFDATRAKKQAREEQEIILTRQRLQLKFGHLLRGIISATKLEEGSYYFKFKGGADPDPAFRMEVDGLLQLKDKKLILYTYPESGTPRRELLVENIQSIKFLFFDEEKKEFSEGYPKKTPRMVKVVLNNSDKEVLPIFL